MRVINVLYYEHPGGGIGGSKVSLLNLVRGLGADVQPFLAGKFPAEIVCQFPSRCCWLRIASSLWPPPPMSFFGRYGKTARWLGYFVMTGLRLARAIRRHRIDIVHGNNQVNSNAPAILAAILTGRPYVCHLRGTQRPRWETRWLHDHVDQYIAISEDVRHYYAQKGLLNGKAASVVFNGVDVSLLAERAAAVARQRTGTVTRVAMFGRMIEFKGHEYFIRAAAEVIRKHPEIEFVVNGPVPGPADPDWSYYQDLCGTIESLGLGGHIAFAGPYADVAEVMGQTDVAVCCSPYSNFGRVLFEAMACGVPVVAFDCGGTREVAVGEENCLMASNRDHVALAQAIVRAATDRSLRERLIAEGRSTAVRLFDYRTNAQEVLRIYEGLIAPPAHEMD